MRHAARLMTDTQEVAGWFPPVRSGKPRELAGNTFAWAALQVWELEPLFAPFAEPLTPKRRAISTWRKPRPGR